MRRAPRRSSRPTPRAAVVAAAILRAATSITLLLGGPCVVAAQTRQAPPLRQSALTTWSERPEPLTLRDASRDDRWLGVGVRDVRWAPDGSVVYFRWTRDPRPGDVPEQDPWFRADARGRWVEEVAPADAGTVPGSDVVRSADGRRAAWVTGGALWLYEAGGGTQRVVSLERPLANPRFREGGGAVDVESGEALYRYGIADGALTVVARRTTRSGGQDTEAAAWLRAQQSDLFALVRRQEDERQARAEASRRAVPAPAQAVLLPPGIRVDGMQRSPDGRHLFVRATTPDTRRPATRYVDYLDASGYAEVHEAREKVGEPRDVVRLGVVTVDPTVPADSVRVRWITLAEAGDENTVPSMPSWNLEGTRAVVQFIGERHEDLWIAQVDPTTGAADVLVHDHDDAWLGGPPVQANYLQPALLEWLPGDRLVFASERSGWSHLYLAGAGNTVTPLTQGPWEVRGARLSPDRATWLIQASREHPSEDHLYRMPAAGGALERLTSEPGRHEGWWSPDGRRLALVSSESLRLPDLWVRGADPGAEAGRMTVSGTDAFWEHPSARPEIVTFDHPDGGPLWAALFRPEHPNPERAAVVHIHGGGYRQFAHRGWSVYGHALHLGFLNYMLQQGYTVLDFDYRGSAGYGRDYRTDIADAMGISDTDGAVAAARWLAATQDVDPDRIGIYGVSYGGFLTLTSLFRYPGVFHAGIANAAVTDWAHYSDGWTSRILGVPHDNPEAYLRSSPIYYAEGLADPLLITHGLVDDNVHFQDAARLIQRLIELEKPFQVVVYPAEPHTIQTEPSRYDYVRRAVTFFDEHLRGVPRPWGSVR